MTHLSPGDFQGKYIAATQKALEFSPKPPQPSDHGRAHAEDTSKGEQDATTTQDACRHRQHSLEEEACQHGDSSPLAYPGLMGGLGRAGSSVVGTCVS